jgi:hypothetical protein
MINLEGSVGPWRDWEKPVRLAGIRAEIWTRYLPNTKHLCWGRAQRTCYQVCGQTASCNMSVAPAWTVRGRGERQKRSRPAGGVQCLRTAAGKERRCLSVVVCLLTSCGRLVRDIVATCVCVEVCWRKYFVNRVSVSNSMQLIPCDLTPSVLDLWGFRFSRRTVCRRQTAFRDVAQWHSLEQTDVSEVRIASITGLRRWCYRPDDGGSTHLRNVGLLPDSRRYIPDGCHMRVVTFSWWLGVTRDWLQRRQWVISLAQSVKWRALSAVGVWMRGALRRCLHTPSWWGGWPHVQRVPTFFIKN